MVRTARKLERKRAGSGEKGGVGGKRESCKESCHLVFPQPPRVFRACFLNLRFPHYLGAWNRLCYGPLVVVLMAFNCPDGPPTPLAGEGVSKLSAAIRNANKNTEEQRR